MPILPLKLPPILHEEDGEVRIIGHRISIVDILQFYRDGCTPEMLAARYEILNLAQIHYVIAFYHEHQQALDTYLNDYLAECDRRRLEATKTRLEQHRESGLDHVLRHIGEVNGRNTGNPNLPTC